MVNPNKTKSSMTIFKFCACDIFNFSVTNICAYVQFNLATLRSLMLCCDRGADAYKLVAVDKNGWYFTTLSKVHGIKFKKHVRASLYEAIELCGRVSNMIT